LFDLVDCGGVSFVVEIVIAAFPRLLRDETEYGDRNRKHDFERLFCVSFHSLYATFYPQSTMGLDCFLRFATLSNPTS